MVRGTQGSLKGLALVSLVIIWPSWSITATINIARVNRWKEEVAELVGNIIMKTNIIWKIDTAFLPPKQSES